MNKLVEREAFIGSVRVKSVELKHSFPTFLRISVFPRCRERPWIVMLWVEWFGRLKWRATGLEPSPHFFERCEVVRKNGMQVFCLFL